MENTPTSQLRPTTWADVKEAVLRGDVHLLGRSEHGLAVYAQWREKVLSQHASITDVLLNKVFGYPLAVKGSGKLGAKRPKQTSDRLCLIKNDFPYDLPGGVRQYVLWSESRPVTEEDLADAAKQHFDGHDVVYWVNPVKLQSVKDIYHGHMLVKHNE